MTLLYIDGFETQDSSRYDAGGTIGFSSSGTRFGYGYCLDVSRPIFSKSLGSNETTLITGFALKTNGDSFGVAFVGDGGVSTNSSIYLQPNGGINAYRGNIGGTDLGGAAPAGSYPTNAWFYLEIKAVIDNSSGSIEIKIDGVTKLNVTGVDTRLTTSTGCDKIIYTYQTTGGNRQMDDLYICNASGSVNNGFLGDVRVATLAPTGNGNSSQLVGSDGNSTDNYLLVDESPPNTTDYVASATSGNKDSYVMGDLPGGAATILGVQQVARLIKTDAGAMSAKHLIRTAATNYTSAGFALSTGWVTYTYIRETNPNTSVAWSVAEVDAHEAGIEIA